MKTSKIFLFLTFLIFTTSCNKPNPNPEIADPIYQDLNREQSNIEKSIETKNKEFEKFEDDKKKLVSGNPELKKAWSVYFKAKKELEMLEQKHAYLKLRIHSRLVQDRTEYLEAFQKKLPWPPKESYEIYLEQKKLASASRVWRPNVAKAQPKKKEAGRRPAASHEN